MSDTTTGAHWHVASGLAGYGPDGADGFDTVDTMEQLADAVREELAYWSDQETSSAEAYAESGDFKSAWMLHKHAELIEQFRMNLDNARASAPLYVDNRPLWHETIRATVTEHFPFGVDEGNQYVFAWLCDDGAECDHLTDED